MNEDHTVNHDSAIQEREKEDARLNRIKEGAQSNVISFDSKQHKLTFHKSEAFELCLGYLSVNLRSFSNLTAGRAFGYAVDMLFNLAIERGAIVDGEIIPGLAYKLERITLYDQNGEVNKDGQYVLAKPVSGKDDPRFVDASRRSTINFDQEHYDKFQLLVNLFGYKDTPEALINLLVTAVTILQAQLEDQLYVSPTYKLSLVI